MLRVEGRIPREVDHYYEAIENIAYSLGVDEHLLEVLIDFIIGNPIDIYRLTKNQAIIYDLDKLDQCSQFFKTLDTARLKSLQKMFKGSDQSLAHVFLHWHHNYQILEV